MKDKICTWNKTDFGNIFENKKRLVLELTTIQQKGMEFGWDIDLKEEKKDLDAQLEVRERQEDIFWKQKSRIKWLQEGEKNTKLFHNSVVHNRLGMKIHKIKRANRTQVETREEVEEELSSYFKGIMTKDNYSREQEIA